MCIYIYVGYIGKKYVIHICRRCNMFGKRSENMAMCSNVPDMCGTKQQRSYWGLCEDLQSADDDPVVDRAGFATAGRSISNWVIVAVPNSHHFNAFETKVKNWWARCFFQFDSLTNTMQMSEFATATCAVRKATDEVIAQFESKSGSMLHEAIWSPGFTRCGLWRFAFKQTWQRSWIHKNPLREVQVKN